MARKKKVVAKVKLYLKAGEATPGPPVGTTLGTYGINLGKFVQEYNAKTRDQAGNIIPVIITIYEDKSFDLEFRKPPTSFLLKKAANIVKGASQPGRETVAKIPYEKVVEIAKYKLDELNADDLDKAVKIVMGTARSMGIEVEEK